MLDQERAHAPLSAFMVPVVISLNPSGGEAFPGFVVTQGDRTCDGLGWDEMIGQVIGLTHPKISSAHYRMMTPAERRVDEARRELKIAERELENEQSNAGFAF